MAISFGTAVIIFVNFWLVALTAFGTITSGIFLYILGDVNDDIEPSVAVSLLCAAFSFLYLVLQSVNVSDKQYRWHKSWLGSACLQIPRVLIICWVVTTTLGLVVAIKQPLCQNGDVNRDAEAWQAGLGCWVFRVLVSLDVVMLVLTFSIFIFLEINGRYVPIGLFHFEFAAADQDDGSHRQSRHHQRRMLVASAYGDSVESLASPVTITSEDERTMNVTEKINARSAYPSSPSPTYRTLDLTSSRSRAPVLPNLCLSALDEESLLDHPASRQSTCTTTTFATVPVSHLSLTQTDSIFASGQLQARPLSLSDIPALPSKFQQQLKELEALGKIRATVKTNSATRSALHDVANSPTGNLKSSCALPLSHPSTTTLPTTSCSKNLAKSSENRRPPLSEVIDKPAPAWCPYALESVPFSADPAIKRLTELRRNSGPGTHRISRPVSLNAFEFGFGGTNRSRAKAHRRIDQGIDFSPVRRAIRDFDDAKKETVVPMGKLDAAHDKENIGTKSDALAMTRPAANVNSGECGLKTAKSTSTGKSLTMMPRPVPERSATRVHGRGESQHASGHGRKRSKSVVERARYEKLPR